MLGQNHKRRYRRQRLRKKEPLQICYRIFGCFLCMLSLTLSVSGVELKLEPTKYSEYKPQQNAVEGYGFPVFSCPAPGLWPFFSITRCFMSPIVGKSPLPPGYTEVDGHTLGIGPKVRANQWGALITHNWLITLIFVTMIIIAILVPIIGLYICIRECFEDDNEEGSERSSSFLCCGSVLLGLLILGLLFGFIAAFVTSNYLELAEKDYNAAMLATVAFATTSRQLNRMLISNYTQMSYKLQRSLFATLDSIRRQLTLNSMERSQGFLKDFQTKQQNITDKLFDMLNATNALLRDGAQLADVLRGVRRQFSEEFVTYSKLAADGNEEYPFSPYYMDLLRKYEMSILGDRGIRCKSMPRIKITIVDLMAFFKVTPFITGINDMDKINAFITAALEELEIKVERIVDALAEAGDILKKAAKEMQLEMIRNIDLITAEKVIDDLQLKYDPYRFCIGIIATSVLLLILICLLCGLLCGICGKRSSGGVRNRCCNRSDGALFLMGAAFLIFVFTPLFVLSALGHFLPGILAHRVYCDSVAASNRPFDFMIASCRKNESIYVALNAKEKRIGELEEFKTYSSKIKKMLVQLKHTEMRLEEAQPTIAKLMSVKDRRKFERLRTSKALVHFKEGRFVDHLEEQITPKPIEEILDKQYPVNHTASGPLMQKQIDNLDQFNEPLVKPMIVTALKLKDLAYELENLFIYNQYCFEESLDLLLQEHDKALQFEKAVKCWAYFVDDTLKEFSFSMVRTFDRYVSMILDPKGTAFGNCYELAVAYDLYHASICCAFVDLICGFWLAILWCLLLFLPILCLAFRLASLYHKLDPYPYPYQEESTVVKETRSVTFLEKEEAVLVEQPRPRTIIRTQIIRPVHVIAILPVIPVIPVVPVVPVVPVLRRTTSEPRELHRTRSFKRIKDDYQHLRVRRRRSQTSESSSSSSDLDIIIKRKSKKD